MEGWAPAWQRVTSEGTPRALGFTVDAGQACLLDQAALPFLIDLADDEEASIELSLRVNRQLFEPVVDAAIGMNVIVFACGTRWTIKCRPWNVRRALPWDTKTSAWQKTTHLPPQSEVFACQRTDSCITNALAEST